jgi:putative transposase
MPNHVHLLVSPSTEDGISLLMRHLGSRYVHYVNRVYQRTGTLWEGRFRSSLIGGERYLLACHHHIESNPVQERLVAGPADYEWSSYRHHADGREDPLIQNHRIYLELGANDRERQRAYRERFRNLIDGEERAEIRRAINGGLVLGEDHFKDEIERVVARRVRPGKSGRPRKRSEETGVST